MRTNKSPWSCKIILSSETDTKSLRSIAFDLCKMIKKFEKKNPSFFKAQEKSIFSVLLAFKKFKVFSYINFHGDLNKVSF